MPARRWRRPAPLVSDASAQAGNVWPLANAAKSPFSTNEKLNTFEDITSYNNFYEFGTDKGDPAAQRRQAQDAAVDGEGRRARRQAGDLRPRRHPQARRSRSASTACAASRRGRWSSRGSASRSAELLKRVEPTSKAKYVAFTTLRRPGADAGPARSRSLDWPYVEGLRLDEAMHPLTILAVGLYGETLPNQNGAPLRLVVPWKYGFKSIKSIVQITLRREAAADHAGTSPAPQRVRLLLQRQPGRRPPALEPGTRAAHRRVLRAGQTLMFNGYGDRWRRCTRGMDLKKNY